MANKVLSVPYFSQPTDTTCQGTTLKMMASFLDAKRGQSGAGGQNPVDIKKSINSDKGRPSKATNAHANMKWWLEQNYPDFKFEYTPIKNADDAAAKLVKIIDSGYPALVSISHSRVEGHIILVVGYANYYENACSDVQFVTHDPYGDFDPDRKGTLYGKNRWSGGMCLMSGGEHGPGAFTKTSITGVGRSRKKDPAKGSFYFLYPVGN